MGTPFTQEMTGDVASWQSAEAAEGKHNMGIILAHTLSQAERFRRSLQEAPGYVFFGDQPYAFAQAPPISMARSASLRRSVLRKGSTACS